MLCLTLLLAFQNPLPEVGSPSAIEADAAYRTWVDGISMPPVTPAHMEYAISATMEMPVDGQQVQLSLDCDLEVDFQSLHRYRCRMRGDVQMDTLGQVDFQGEMLFDGETIWIHGAIDSKILEIDEKGMIKCDQDMVEDGYTLLLDMLPRLLESEEMEELGLQEAFRGILEIFPADLGTYLHPAGYMYFGSRTLTCRRYQETEGFLDLDLTIDMREGSFMGSLFEVIAELEGTDELTASDKAEIDLMQKFSEASSVHLRFDRATGIPLAMETTFVFDPELLDPEGTDGLEGPVQMTLTMLGSHELPASIDDALFTAPQADEQTIDVTPFLQLGLNALQITVDEMASDEDMDF
ncbi:MAG: hypothetical protein ACYTEP_06770 [Planctomycetota bacterium]|jgi:hypothetical protein